MSRPLQPMWESLMRDERAWRRIAIIAGVLSVLIVAVMLVSFFARETDPSLDGTYVELKQSLQDARGDSERHGTIANQIRVLDVELRKEYFDRRAIMTVASWLLLASVFVTIASAKMVATIGRRAPILGEIVSDGGDPDAMISVQSISAVGGFALGVLLFSGWLIVSARNVLPSSANQIAALFPEPESIVSVSTGSNNEATLAETASKAERVDERAIEKDLLPTAQATPLPTLEEKLKNWTRFRGTDGSGVGLNASIPEAWDVESGEGVLWKSPIELPGSNSPIVWGDRVFLSGATAEERAVYCFDARTGDLVWQTQVPLPAPESGDGEPVEMEVNDDTGFAAPTMTTDGVRVYAMFAHGDVVAMSFDGEIAWRREFGFPNNPYGHASSLVAEGDVVLVQLDQGSEDEPESQLIALAGSTGETAWETKRDVPASWSTPLVVEYEGERQVITCANPWVIAYRVSDGEELWRCDALYQDVGPSPVAADGIVYVCNEVPGGAAIRLGGSGDVTETHVDWIVDFGAPDTTSPLLVDNMVLMLASFGTLTSYDVVEAGDPLWEVDFDDGFKASPTRIGEHVLLIGESGLCWLVTVTKEGCDTVWKADFGERVSASPAVLDERIYVRGTTIFSVSVDHECDRNGISKRKRRWLNIDAMRC